MAQNRYEIAGQGRVDVTGTPLIGEQNDADEFSLAECPINEIEKFDVIKGYAAEWRKAFDLIPQDLSRAENLALAKKFSLTAKQHEAAITATLTEIKNRRIEIMRPAPDKMAVAETLDRAEEVLDGLLTEIKKTRLSTEKRVEKETNKQREAVLKACLADVSQRTKAFFAGPLDVVQHQDCLPALVKAGKGKRTLETYSEAVYAKAETIIAERIELATLCAVNLDLINATELPAVSAVADTLMQRPTTEVKSVIAQRQAEAEAVALKKQAAVQRNQERLATNKAAIEQISDLQHLDNWRREHKASVEAELPHPDDQAELWQFFGAHYTRIESRKKPPHHADAQQGGTQKPDAKGDCKTCWNNQFNSGCKEPTCRYEKKPILHANAIDAPPYPTPDEGRAMYEETLKTEAVKRAAAASPTGKRPQSMPETGLAFTMTFWCGQMDTAGAKGLYERICDLVEADGGEVFVAERI
jgi:hypothetical protein